MTQRAPVYAGVPARQRPVELLTWTHGPSIFAAPTPMPCGVQEWPRQNPVLRKQDLSLRVWTNGIPETRLSDPVPPIRNYDFPNPKLVVRSKELLTWVHTQQIPSGVVASPFIPPDFPNPRPGRQNLELRTWISQLVPGALTPPFSNPLFPNPGRSPLGVDFYNQGRNDSIYGTLTQILGIASEIDQALGLNPNKAKLLGMATETDSSLAFGINKARLLGIALEFDLAITIAGGQQSQTPSSGIPILQISKYLRIRK